MALPAPSVGLRVRDEVQTVFGLARVQQAAGLQVGGVDFLVDPDFVVEVHHVFHQREVREQEGVDRLQR